MRWVGSLSPWVGRGRRFTWIHFTKYARTQSPPVGLCRHWLETAGRQQTDTAYPVTLYTRWNNSTRASKTDFIIPYIWKSCIAPLRSFYCPPLHASNHNSQWNKQSGEASPTRCCVLSVRIIIIFYSPCLSLLSNFNHFSSIYIYIFLKVRFDSTSSF